MAMARKSAKKVKQGKASRASQVPGLARGHAGQVLPSLGLRPQPGGPVDAAALAEEIRRLGEVGRRGSSG